MNTLFIFFGGHNMANDFWNYDPIVEKNTNFISEFEKIGDVYMFQPSYYNICYYDDKNESLKKYYGSELDFNIEDISFEKQALLTYNEIKKTKMYKYYIIVCTSIGIHYAIELQKILKTFLIISIEGSSIGQNAKIKFSDSIKKYEDVYIKYDNIKLNTLKRNKIYGEINDFIMCKLNSMIDFSMIKFNVHSLHFQNLIMVDKMNKKDIDKNLLKIDTVSQMEKNDSLYKCIWIINKTHQPFWTDPYLILKHVNDEINNLLNKSIVQDAGENKNILHKYNKYITKLKKITNQNGVKK